MLVDDDIATIEVFSEYLELRDINVVSYATNGIDAIEEFKKHRPDMLFVDVMMPKYDGFFTLEEIRKIDSSIPIIMVTADLSKNTEERLLDLKASKIIYKPFEIRELFDCIGKFSKKG